MAPIDSEENGGITVDEETPLLANSSTRANTGPEGNKNALSQSSSHATDEDDKPLPKTQIFLLSFTRLVDPIAYFCIFPFVNEMIYETGNIREEDVGFYSGLIVRSSASSIGIRTEILSRNHCFRLLRCV